MKLSGSCLLSMVARGPPFCAAGARAEGAGAGAAVPKDAKLIKRVAAPRRSILGLLHPTADATHFRIDTTVCGYGIKQGCRRPTSAWSAVSRLLGQSASASSCMAGPARPACAHCDTRVEHVHGSRLWQLAAELHFSRRPGRAAERGARSAAAEPLRKPLSTPRCALRSWAGRRSAWAGCSRARCRQTTEKEKKRNRSRRRLCGPHTFWDRWVW